MFKIFIPKLLGHYRGMSLGFFIILQDKSQLNDFKLIHHETIHFYQQIELLFLPMWLLYGLFYCIGRVRGLNHNQAYRNIPFEKEAYSNEADLKYLFKRKPYAWVKYL
jgi:hypothetical protein